MKELIYDDDDLTIFKQNSKFYISYDAGSHQVSIREDEITKEETDLVMQGTKEATKVLLTLQKRLEDAGEKPYESNV